MRNGSKKWDLTTKWSVCDVVSRQKKVGYLLSKGWLRWGEGLNLRKGPFDWGSKLNTNLN